MTDDGANPTLSILDRLLAGQEQLQAGQDRLQASQDRLQAGQDQLGAGQDQLRADVHARFAALEARIDALDVRVGRLEKRLERLDSDHIRTRTELMARMDRLQESWTVQNESEVVSISVGERAERLAKAAQDDVRGLSEQVSLMRRQILRLQTDIMNLQNGPHGHAA